MQHTCTQTHCFWGIGRAFRLGKRDISMKNDLRQLLNQLTLVHDQKYLEPKVHICTTITGNSISFKKNTLFHSVKRTSQHEPFVMTR